MKSYIAEVKETSNIHHILRERKASFFTKPIEFNAETFYNRNLSHSHGQRMLRPFCCPNKHQLGIISPCELSGVKQVNFSD